MLILKKSGKVLQQQIDPNDLLHPAHSQEERKSTSAANRSKRFASSCSFSRRAEKYLSSKSIQTICFILLILKKSGKVLQQQIDPNDLLEPAHQIARRIPLMSAQ
eukprot:CAMPEP_0172193810 /NCGR_PEP_ID=MMETSP1050-20130122/25188_1 /TAXON_ID=233186 /ORGANISM="Cryptomonas curvata, Strain CCAP979/52" /LENGTH=104 /DNA_ID=CAMNT_0012869461 /DNA_START=559 /DNA_END=873 /DNA_ORIENTATION=-